MFLVMTRCRAEIRTYHLPDNAQMRYLLSHGRRNNIFKYWTKKMVCSFIWVKEIFEFYYMIKWKDFTNICEYILLFLDFSYYFLTLTVILMYLTTKIFRKQGWHHLGSEAQKLEQFFFCNHYAVRTNGRTI